MIKSIIWSYFNIFNRKVIVTTEYFFITVLLVFLLILMKVL